MMPRTRLDKLVRLRERVEDDALGELARARQELAEAQDRLETAESAARADGRGRGRAALWELEETAHRRALQSLRVVRGEVASAAKKQEVASSGYREAHQDAEVARRVAERKRAEILREGGKRERRAADEIATLRFNLK
jgi:flagellar export protein FliJ